MVRSRPFCTPTPAGRPRTAASCGCGRRGAWTPTPATPRPQGRPPRRRTRALAARTATRTRWPTRLLARHLRAARCCALSTREALAAVPMWLTRSQRPQPPPMARPATAPTPGAPTLARTRGAVRCASYPAPPARAQTLTLLRAQTQARGPCRARMRPLMASRTQMGCPQMGRMRMRQRRAAARRPRRGTLACASLARMQTATLAATAASLVRP